uniref:BSD domain containing 1 n=1 Tax=Seriola lalandi dorsalis TaxID=1841481 RepID=A0A3B4Y2M2_SERLL
TLYAHREGWWGGWFQQSFQAVKDKSSEALEFLKRDLTEFSTVVQHDTACSIVATATAVRNKLAARLYSLQADPATYCNEPDGPPEQFDNWLSSFSLEEKKGEISELLVNSPSIRALYTKMVPAAVAHSEFWQRYFYKVFQLDQEEARRVALKQRAEQTTHTETLGWEEEEEGMLVSVLNEYINDKLINFKNHSLTLPLGCQMISLAPRHHLNSTLQPPWTTPQPSSSDSVSLPTQVEVRPEPVTTELAEKLTEASLEDVVDKTQEEQRPGKSDSAPEAQMEAVTQPGVTVDGAPVRTTTSKPEAAKEEGPQDLRVFELNSDSGKSRSVEDWEKDFDLDMTEEEVQLALSKIEDSGELDEDWENWD